MSTTTHIKAQNWDKAKPKLSVLIPFYRDDPSELLMALNQQNVPENSVEIIIYDDGTDDIGLSSGLESLLGCLDIPAHMMIASHNMGRAVGRNKLQDAARADWVLFLDADMRPMSETFLKDYISLIERDVADVIFGGFKVETESSDKSRDLHRALSEVSDCLSLEQRQAAGPQYVATSNLCVKKSVLHGEPFDSSFQGWGWEDSEWAARVARSFRLCHVDNPALHLGLETTDTLLARFKDSGSNYLRFTQKHPELAQSLSLFKTARKLGRIPGQAVMRPILKSLVRSEIMPMTWRIAALKLWRASWYADMLTNPRLVKGAVA